MRIVAVATTLLLGGCIALRPGASGWVDSATWQTGELRALQRIELCRENERRSIQAVVEGSRTGLSVALLDALGRRLLLLRSGPSGYSEERDARLPRSVDGRQILADMVLAHWPEPELRALLPPTLALEQHGATRTLRGSGAVLAIATCHGDPFAGRCVVEHPHQRYVLDILSRREDP